MTKDQLRAALEDAGITAPADAPKAELEALAADIGTPADVGAQRPVHMTRRQIQEWSTR
jgi:hypothetical protein